MLLEFGKWVFFCLVCRIPPAEEKQARKGLENSASESTAVASTYTATHVFFTPLRFNILFPLSEVQT